MKYVIDGNISSGKSTQVSLLAEDGYDVKKEPIEDWPLDQYYSDPRRWGFLFQMAVLHSHSKTIDTDLCIYERSPSSGIHVFWPVMEKDEVEDMMYKKFYKELGWEPDVYIFIDKSPEKCYEHIIQRGQTGDNGVQFDYLKNLDIQYQKYFNDLSCKKFRIDGNQTIEKVHEDILKILKSS